MENSSTSSPFAVSVQEVFTLQGSGTVVVGQVTAGTVKSGAGAFLVRAGGFAKPLQILKILVSRKPVPEATVGVLVGLLLKGVEKSEVMPGDLVQSRPSKSDV